LTSFGPSIALNSYTHYNWRFIVLLRGDSNSPVSDVTRFPAGASTFGLIFSKSGYILKIVCPLFDKLLVSKVEAPLEKVEAPRLSLKPACGYFPVVAAPPLTLV
jgi:hypothetical protein